MSDDRIEDRRDMVKEQLEKRAIRNPLVLQAMLDIPRHLFVPSHLQDEAYRDGALDLGKNQSISQPYIVASMIQSIEPQNTHRVLEVGTGSGYSAAVLSHLVEKVYSIERDESLIAPALKIFKDLNITNILVKKGDGSLGWAEEGPFDAILVTAAAPQVPPALVAQLKVGGVLVLPIGGRGEQKLFRVVKRGEGRYQEKELYAVRFVPLIGEQGWKE